MLYLYLAASVLSSFKVGVFFKTWFCESSSIQFSDHRWFINKSENHYQIVVLWTGRLPFFLYNRQNIIYNAILRRQKCCSSYKLTHICLVDPSILINWTNPFSICLVYFFIFILFPIDIPVSRQWRPWSDAAFWSGSALFAYVPNRGTRLLWVKYEYRYKHQSQLLLVLSSNPSNTYD